MALCMNIIDSFMIMWCNVSHFSSFMILTVVILYEVKPRIGQEHFMRRACNLVSMLHLLFINIGHAYLKTLTISELVRITLVCLFAN